MTGYIVIIICICIALSATYQQITTAKLDKSRAAQRVADKTAWLEEQEKALVYCIQFSVNGLTRTTESFPVRVGDLIYNATSKQMATSALEDSYLAGFFQDDTGMTYPSCNISWATIVPVSSERK